MECNASSRSWPQSLTLLATPLAREEHEDMTNACKEKYKALQTFGDFLVAEKLLDDASRATSDAFARLCQSKVAAYSAAADELHRRLSKSMKAHGKPIGFTVVSTSPLVFKYEPAVVSKPTGEEQTKEKVTKKEPTKEKKATKQKKAAKKEPTKAKLVEETSGHFVAHLTYSKEVLESITTAKAFQVEFDKWLAGERASGKHWKGGPTVVLKALVRKGIVKKKKKQAKLEWSAATLKLAVRNTEIAKPFKKNKKVLKQAQYLAKRVVRDRSLVEQNKGGLVVGELDLACYTAEPKEVLDRTLCIRNNGKHVREVRTVVMDCKPPSDYTAKFELKLSVPLPHKLAPGCSMDVLIKCTMPANAGCTKGLLSVCTATFAIGRFVALTCGNAKLLDELKPTSEYQPKKQAKKRVKGPAVPAPYGVSGGKQRFALPLGDYFVTADWKESVRQGEGGKLLEKSKELAPLGPSTYVQRFKRLLWCEENSQVEQLKLYSLENVSMKATSATRLALHVAGLAENRPSVLRGDTVEVTFSAGKEEKARKFIGKVEMVERDRVLLAFDRRLHESHNASMRYDVHFVFRRVQLRLAHQGLSLSSTLRQGLLFPGTSAPSLPVQELHLFNNRLNRLQRVAVEHVLAGAGATAPYLLYGPPGTGKTTTLVEMVAQSVEAGKRVLAVAPTNAAANIICERLHQLGGSPCGSSLQKDGKMLRHMAFSHRPSLVSEVVIEHTTLRNNEFPNPCRAVVDTASVVISTLSSAAKLYNLFNSTNKFDAVFIDEAGQALEPECIAPLATLMTTNGQVILAGDHKQLGPVVLSAIGRNHGLGLSFLERLSRTPLYQRAPEGDGDHVGYDPRVMTMLTENYRSHPLIIDVPNRLFYHSALTAAGDPEHTHCLADWERLPATGVPIIFHQIVGNNTREASSPSWFNPDEAAQVLSYVELLLEQPDILPTDIGVIAPYHKQVQKIKKALASAGIDVDPSALKVGSTELFQGQERRIIIISTTRSDPSFLDLDQSHNLGFVANAKRFNVAVTRAEALLIVVGNANVLATDENWECLLQHCKRHGAWAGEEVALPSDLKIEAPETPSNEVAPNDKQEELATTSLVNKLRLFFTSIVEVDSDDCLDFDYSSWV